MWFEIVTFILLIVALAANIGSIDNKKAIWGRFKILGIVTGIVIMFWYTKEMAKYSIFIFIFALISLIKKDKPNGQDNHLDRTKLG